MSLADELQSIVGAQELHDWFGYWPSFHDDNYEPPPEPAQPVFILIHTWEMTNKVDEGGFYVLEKHVVVEFIFEGISGLDLSGFSHQNVIFGLELEKKIAGFVLTLDPCYGLAGRLRRRISQSALNPASHQTVGKLIRPLKWRQLAVSPFHRSWLIRPPFCTVVLCYRTRMETTIFPTIRRQ